MIVSAQNDNQLSLVIVDDNLIFSTNMWQISQFSKACNLFENDKGLIQNTTLKISEKIKEKINNNDNIPILINIEGKYDNSKRQDQKGLEILLWLRCKFKVPNPVVAYSFQSVHHLLNKKSENYLICSKGCYPLQLPYNFSQINLKVLEQVKDWGELRKYLKPAFSIDEFKHREANWWGIVQLIDVHRFIFPDELKFEDGKEYPLAIIKNLKMLNNIIALDLYGHNDFSTIMEDISVELLYKELKKINYDFELWEKRLTNHPTRKNPKPEELIDYLNDRIKFIKEKEKDTKWKNKPVIEKQIRETEEKIRQARKQFDELKIRKAEIDRKLNPLKPRSISVKEEFKNEINNLRFIHKKNKPKILYVDDQAHDGWSEIFQFMIYGKISNERFVIANLNITFENIENYIDIIFSKLKSHLKDIDLILLDLRLLPSWDEKQKYFIEEMSGAKLLQRIRIEYPGIPIIITTASNKVWTYEKLIELGADAYWIKEGLEEQRTEDQLVKNYIRFLELINKILGAEYSLLKYFSDEIIKLKEHTDYWWENFDWTTVGNKTTMSNEKIPLTTKTPKENIYEILENSFLILRNYLQLKILQHGFNPYINEKEWFFPSQIIQNLGKIIEEVHNFEKINYMECKRINRELIKGYKNKDNGKFFITRNDVDGYEHFGTRNDASHLPKCKELKWSDAKDYIEKIMLYLNNSPKKRN